MVMKRDEVLLQLLKLGGDKTDAFTKGVFDLGINDADTAEQRLLMRHGHGLTWHRAR